MSGRVGSITTDIIADGLGFNMDAANRASYPVQRTLATAESGSCYNTLDLSQSGSFISDPQFVTQPASASSWVFDGIDDYMMIGPSANVGNNFTFSVWYKPTDLTGEGYGYLLSSDPTVGNDKGFAIDEGGGAIGAGKVYYYNGSASTVLASTAVSLNAWACLTFVTNVTGNEIKFYLNGLLDKTTTVTSIETDYDYIGVWGATETHYLIGQLANVTMYDRPLSASEVLHNYNALKGRFS